MRILSAAERFAASDRSRIFLDTDRCLHLNNQLSTCAACFDICPVEAIQPGKPPTLETSKCQHCLACLPVCPVGAYSTNDAVPKLLTCIARLETKKIELVCEMNDNPSMGVIADSMGILIKGCLAGLGSGTYLAIAAIGFEEILLRLDICEQCPWGTLKKEIIKQIRWANKILMSLEKGNFLVCVSTLDEPVERLLLDADNPALSRRDLFQLAARRGQMTMARAMVNDKSAGGHRLGRDRLRTILALSHLPDVTTGGEILLDSGDYARITITKACTACKTCARSCPVNSLHFSMNAEKTSFQLEFEPQLCIGCSFCVNVCAAEAIEISHSPTFTQVFGISGRILLQEGKLSLCVKCKAPFANETSGEYCPVCEYRRKHPFESKTPPTSNLPEKISRGIKTV